MTDNFRPLKKLERWRMRWFSRCPNCHKHMDNDYHGLKQQWLHCHACGFCTYERAFK